MPPIVGLEPVVRAGGSSLRRTYQLATCGARMGWGRKVSGGMVATIGYLLSPLSWWNDMFVNVPLALVFAWVVSAFYHPAFVPALVVGYWLTNVLGFVLMHKGGLQMFSGEPKKYRRKHFVKDVLISLLYTLLIVALIRFGVLKPFNYYFGEPQRTSSLVMRNLECAPPNELPHQRVAGNDIIACQHFPVQAFD
jgi:hypothetical protein